ncbi:hypothetical protein, partial [Rhodococcus sp. BH5]|uniref:hypothetical protein n=1 Tax=Rhodococcus sp. BH5 TaxID=2871702 RepID=UPI0022CD4220
SIRPALDSAGARFGRRSIRPALDSAGARFGRRSIRPALDSAQPKSEQPTTTLPHYAPYPAYLPQLEQIPGSTAVLPCLCSPPTDGKPNPSTPLAPRCRPRVSAAQVLEESSDPAQQGSKAGGG